VSRARYVLAQDTPPDLVDVVFDLILAGDVGEANMSTIVGDGDGGSWTDGVRPWSSGPAVYRRFCSVYVLRMWRIC